MSIQHTNDSGEPLNDRVNRCVSGFCRAEKLVEEAIDAPALSNTPPCARYEGGENNARLILVWTYVAGLVGGGLKADELSHKVARLYDTKGLLVVATRNKLSTFVETSFRKSWVEVGHEFEDQVEFCDVGSELWKCLWTARRFESDWRP